MEYMKQRPDELFFSRLKYRSLSNKNIECEPNHEVTFIYWSKRSLSRNLCFEFFRDDL